MAAGMSERRQDAADRAEASWVGTYRLEAHPDLGSGPCRVIDVSTSGAGVELFGPVPDADRHERVLLEIQLGTGTAGIRLAGSVQNAKLTPLGVRVGIEFDDLGTLEKEVLATLLKSAAAQATHFGRRKAS
jgi:hypothetical protein